MYILDKLGSAGGKTKEGNDESNAMTAVAKGKINMLKKLSLQLFQLAILCFLSKLAKEVDIRYGMTVITLEVIDIDFL